MESPAPAGCSGRDEERAMKDESGPTSGTGVYAGLIALILVIAGLVVLAAQNTQSVTIRWLGLSGTTPLIAVLLGVLATVMPS